MEADTDMTRREGELNLTKDQSLNITKDTRIRSRTANHPLKKKTDEILSHRRLSSPQTPHPVTMLKSTESYSKLLHGSCLNFG